MVLHGPGRSFVLGAETTRQVHYLQEEIRGYASVGDLWSPGYFRVDLHKDEEIAMVVSTESWEVINALRPSEALLCERTRRGRLIMKTRKHIVDSTAGELTLAADQFLITPAGRIEDATRAHATGEEIRTVIAGYHWFTDWGRDTMISLEGLTLATDRYDEAGFILRTFAHYIRDGLIPNLFPEGKTQGLYHTADATLWYFHAIDRYIEATGDQGNAPGSHPEADRHHRAPSEGHAIRHRRRPDRRPAAPGARRVSAHLDGREGWRLGCHSAPGQGSGDQRALVQRAAAASGLDSRRTGRAGSTSSGGASRARRAARSMRVFGTKSMATSTTSLMANRATTRLAGQIRCSPCRSNTPYWTASAGSP